jgi:hypothetical protein
MSLKRLKLAEWLKPGADQAAPLTLKTDLLHRERALALRTTHLLLQTRRLLPAEAATYKSMVRFIAPLKTAPASYLKTQQ